ncbi:MBL fold metallo-hydrolase [Aquabacterium sp. A7-Y]|uniref:MBL fold metallo-hydrolase n=1 Tax=Aquabacterium sp. A7-Y TaxID=1349605 RepID=UPI00223CC970|nr:MBL fold metallo-hydrolase [Aquabacterium sp. A7-Y]MCW7540147.1 MBL fold metallo-hydrolase [Aquabacterium sp. A7-Y]
MTGLSLSACRSLPAHPDSPQQRDGRFHNVVQAEQPGWRRSLGILWRFMFEKPSNTVPPQPVPVQPLSTEQLQAAPDGSLFRLGHSTLLMKLEGAYWLTDPVFSERASPVQWAGPKRFHASPIGISDLPEIEAVVLSHDHYDHLDHHAILQLAPKVRHFITPLGVGDRLLAWGVDPAKVRQLDWWQSTQVGSLRLVATPAQHFSGRSLSDRNQTLWASWVFLTAELRLFFSGDTGYHAGFRDIGERYGPFDVTLLETGAYDTQWPDVHMQPHETLQAHQDLQGRWLLPVHNGTFDLAMHAWDDPLERIVALADAQGVAVLTPRMGEAVSLRRPSPTATWWRQLRPSGEAAKTVAHTAVPVQVQSARSTPLGSP